LNELEIDDWKLNLYGPCKVLHVYCTYKGNRWAAQFTKYEDTWEFTDGIWAKNRFEIPDASLFYEHPKTRLLFVVE
jgi:hypothetical protein